MTTLGAPASLRAGSLSDAAQRAASAVAGLYASLPPHPGAELQLTIYPREYRDGPIFDVSGSPGGFAPREQFSGGAGGALEDLVAAVEPMPEAGPGHCMFR